MISDDSGIRSVIECLEMSSDFAFERVTLSLVIPCYNEEKTLESCIEKVIAINTPYFETGGTDIADIAKVRPSDASGFPAARSLEFMLANDPDHAPIKPTQSWMDRINTAQFEVGRDRWQAVQAFAGFDLIGTLGMIDCPVLMLYGEKFIYRKYRRQVHDACPHATVEIIRGGRFCMTWERATDIAAHARSFFA